MPHGVAGSTHVLRPMPCTSIPRARPLQLAYLHAPSHPDVHLRTLLMPPPIRSILLPSERRGSHQHYYHFLLGNVLPLFALPPALREGRQWMFCDPGPLASMLRELGVEPIEWSAFRSLTRHVRKFSLWPKSALHADRYRHLPHRLPLPLAAGLEAMRLEGFDGPDGHVGEGIHRGVRGVLDRLGRRTPPPVDILLVGRGKPDPFYATRALYRGAGNSRRSLTNLAAIGAALSDIPFATVRTVVLEGLSLRDQIDLFSGARLVVAQHGAALANLVWCSPRTRVLEIVPRVPSGVYRDHFERLSLGFGLRYRRLDQDGPHAAVAPEAVAQAARALLDA